MLSRDQLQELGRFKLLMRKMHNQSVQIERFLMDLEYQTQMLDIAEEFDDSDIENDELIMLSLVLRSKFGRLGHGDEAYASIVPIVQSPVEAAPQAKESEQKASTDAASSMSSNSVSLLRSIGSSLASAGSQMTSKLSQTESHATHTEVEKHHYVMSLR